MELTYEILENNGFKYKSPGILSGLYCAEGDWRIMIEKCYAPNSNIVQIKCNCWRGDGTGHSIIARSSAYPVETVEKLNDVIKICGIEKEIK